MKRANQVRLVIILAFCLFFSVGWSAEQLPARLTDPAFWNMISEYSEPGGSFVSDNFVSNELGLQDALKDLMDGRKTGGVYLGVGPEQNFTYVAAMKPKIAFILDIRRQNMIEHLMYKALFEMSEDRADFLSHLFSRPRPMDLPNESGAVVLFNAFDAAAPDEGLYEQTLTGIKQRLRGAHGYALTADDEASLAYILRAFFLGGPDLTYSGPRPANGRTILPTYEELMTDSDADGKPQSFLASDENFRTVQEMEKANLIVPLVGDFAGDRAIRSVARYLKEHDATVTAFYVSNVEQYLFMNDGWKMFYSNAGALPMDSKTVFIRPLINTGPGGYTASPLFRMGFRWDTLLFPMQELISAFNAGTVHTYYDVIQLPN